MQQLDLVIPRLPSRVQNEYNPLSLKDLVSRGGTEPPTY